MKRLGVLVVALCACGSDSKTKMDAASIDAPHDARPIDSPVSHPDAPLDGPPGTQLLTVKNYLSWCSVTVNGGSASSAAQQQVFVQPGQIALTATKASAAFEIGPRMWHHTDGDTGGSGEDGTQANGTSSTTATVISTGAKCVWVCCPFTSGMGCDVADQCL